MSSVSSPQSLCWFLMKFLFYFNLSFFFFLIGRLFSVQPRTELCCDLRSLERGLTVLPNSAAARKFARCRVSVARSGTFRFFFFFGMHVLSGVTALAEGRK